MKTIKPFSQFHIWFESEDIYTGFSPAPHLYLLLMWINNHEISRCFSKNHFILPTRTTFEKPRVCRQKMAISWFSVKIYPKLWNLLYLVSVTHNRLWNSLTKWHKKLYLLYSFLTLIIYCLAIVDRVLVHCIRLELIKLC